MEWIIEKIGYEDSILTIRVSEVTSKVEFVDNLKVYDVIFEVPSYWKIVKEEYICHGKIDTVISPLKNPNSVEFLEEIDESEMFKEFDNMFPILGAVVGDISKLYRFDTIEEMVWVYSSTPPKIEEIVKN